MIYLRSILGDLSSHILTRARHCSAVKIGHGAYRVVPMTYQFAKHHGKAKRRVQFGLHGKRVFVICSDYHTGETCPANEKGKVCCHVAAAYWRFLRSAEMEQRAA